MSKTHNITKRGENVKFKKARERSGLSQQELAQALGVDQSTVCLWETGKTKPRAKLLPALAKTLCCSIDDLLAEDAPEAGDSDASEA